MRHLAEFFFGCYKCDEILFQKLKMKIVFVRSGAVKKKPSTAESQKKTLTNRTIHLLFF